jgi:hydroxymethylglutaryl-CoA reductase
VHPAAQVALKILGVHSARQLAEITVAVGLAQNFAAIRALSTEGIQRGHMRMHARQIAVAAGASGSDVAKVVQQMIDEDNIRPERAREIVAAMRGQA